ncbi:MAG TPA: tetratricopeptide repeat protein [Devosia sp.]|nr:tetratricopeptide repeat protein [Devosia sp.]
MRGLLTAFLLSLALLLAAPGAVPAGDYTDKAALDELFAQLKKAPDASAAEAITQTIWAYWFNPTDPKLAEAMSSAQAAYGEGDFDGSLSILDRIVVDYPDYAEGWNRRATLYYELGNFKASLADIDKVLALEPRHFGALSGRVMIELQLGDRPAALKDMVAALAIHPYLAMKAYFPELNQDIINL